MIRLETVPDARLGNANEESVVLLLEDPHGELDTYLEQNYNHQLRRLIKTPSAVVNRDCLGGFYPNWSELPFPKINQIVVPTGATRWSYGLLLADQLRMEKAYELAAQNDGVLNLHYGANSSNDEEFWLTVSLLDPIPVSNASAVSTANPEQRLWIIPVVDQRYWWQFVDSGRLTATMYDYKTFLEDNAQSLTPSLMIDKIFDIFQGTSSNFAYMVTNVTPSYSTLTAAESDPTPRVIWDNNFTSLSVIFETVLAHYGLTLVADISPTPKITSFVAMDTQNSLHVHDACLQGFVGLRGCVWNGSSPAALSTTMAAANRFVGFPIVTGGGQIPQTGFFLPYAVIVQTILDGITTRFTSPIEAANIGFSTLKTISTLTTRIMTDFIMGDVPMPTVMYNEIAKDYYRHFTKRFDYQFAGCQIWQQTSYDDFTVYRQSWNSKTRSYDVSTRAISRLPGDLGEWDKVGFRKYYAEVTGNLDGATECTWNNSDRPSVTVKAYRPNNNQGLIDIGDKMAAVNRYGIAYMEGTIGEVGWFSDEWKFVGDCDVLPICESGSVPSSSSSLSNSSESVPFASSSASLPPL